MAIEYDTWGAVTQKGFWKKISSLLWSQLRNNMKRAHVQEDYKIIYSQSR